VTSGWRDREVARVTAKQRTLATAEQLYALGISKRAIEYRLASGRLRVVFRGVYTVATGELPPLALELAALLAIGESSFISHRSAAFVWGLRATPPPHVEVSVFGRCCGARKDIRVHRIQKIRRDELRRHEGLWVSSPARAALEVAADAGPDELADVVEKGVAGRVLTPRELEAVLGHNLGRRGAARLAQVLGDEDAMTITRSRAERAFLKLIRDARLPAPQTNQRLGRYVPDFMWRDQRLIVELDSYRFHGGPDAFQNDREKDLVYRDSGFDVLRPTRNHVIHQPARVLVSVVRALGRSNGA
jgi:very-short-patch-repair endonuclease